MPSEFNPRILMASRGKLAFTWNIHMSTIHMYEWEDGAEQPTQNLGMLYSIGADGNVVEFDQAAFEAHVDWFLECALPIGLEPKCNGKCVGSPNFGVTKPDPDCPLHKDDPPQVA